MDNLDLWDKVSKTNPANTKNANVKGNKITSVAPQSQILAATEQWGPYGTKWGWKSLTLGYDLFSEGLVTFLGVFFYPGGEFPIINSISILKDNAKTKIDDDFAKKVETDALTKALSKIGFNADIFMGLFDDTRYVNDLKEEFKNKSDDILSTLRSSIFNKDADWINNNWKVMQSKWELLNETEQTYINSLVKP